MNVPDSPAEPACFVCGSPEAALIADIRRKPAGETDFGISPEAYHRCVYRCQTCSVYYNVQHMVQADIYIQSYNAATYNGDLYKNYLRIRSLPDDKSDNKQRVRRVIDYQARRGRGAPQTSVLDVGSGLCVFLGELKERGFVCYCIDPDPHSARHALEHVHVDSVHCGTLDDYRPERAFDIITFNKVLEHVADPIRPLKLAKRLLERGGLIYIEVPDGEAAMRNGDAIDREEFYIEHFTIFTPSSLQYLIKAAGLRSLEMARIHEPSDKFTLYAFVVHNDDSLHQSLLARHSRNREL
jgi:SAM-dependent methyltransferase